jgi:carbamoyl-phosphate synthase large subunit
LPQHIIEQIITQTKRLGKALEVIGLMNIQYAIKDDELYVLEVNPRASRTVPFVAKATGIELAKIATKVMMGANLLDFKLEEKLKNEKTHVAVKEVVFPFERFPNVDVILGPEMKSTGEVMGIDKDFIHAFIKAQLGSGTSIPTEGTVFVSIKDSDKSKIPPIVLELQNLGFKVVATKGTAEFLKQQGIEVESVNKVLEGSPHIVDFIKDKRIDLIINTTHGKKSILDSFSIRRTALQNKVPCTTTITGARPIVEAIKLLKKNPSLDVFPIQSYIN